jgi:hypothetical protein
VADDLETLVALVRSAIDEQNPPPAPEWLTQARDRIAHRKARKRRREAAK